MRFQLMIYMSLSSVFFALLPFSFLYFEIESERVWRYSGGLLGLYLGLFLVYSIPNYIRLARVGELNGYVAGSTASLGIAAATVQGFAVFYIFEPSIGTYFLGALYLLFLSAVSFARLISQSVSPPNGGDA